MSLCTYSYGSLAQPFQTHCAPGDFRTGQAWVSMVVDFIGYDREMLPESMLN